MRIKNICVIGLGYVGLTLTVVLAEKGFKVLGIEKRKDILDILRQGRAHFYEKGLDFLLKKYLNKSLFLFESVPTTEAINAYIIAVGTPIDDNKKPNLEYIIETVKEIGRNLKDEQIIILRSTVPIGTCREIVLPILKETNRKFYLAFCPERTTEGKALEELRTLPQIIGGLDEESVDRATDIFRKVTCTTIEVDSLENAEMNKIMDNTYRDLIFAYANEMSLICKKLGLDGNKVIEAANLGYPRTNIPIPGFVGGSCLLKDPWIFVDCVQQKINYTPKLASSARLINEGLPNHVFERIKKYLENKKFNNKEVKIFITGLTFKGNPDNDDLRGSTSIDLINKLLAEGFKNISAHDFNIKEDRIRELNVAPNNLEKGFTGADIILIMNNNYRYKDLDIESLIKKMNQGALFFDSWYIYDPKLIKELNWVCYESLGYTNC